MRALFIMLLLLAACAVSTPDHYPELAKCISDKGVKMYGAFWCPHCARVKKSWGDAFEHIDYIECDPRGDNSQTDLCLNNKIEKYSTFRKPSGEELCCEPTPEELAEWAGCEIGA